MYCCPDRQVLLARFPPSGPDSSKLVLIKCPLTTEVVASISSRNPEEVNCSIPVSEYTDIKCFILLQRKNLSGALLLRPKQSSIVKGPHATGVIWPRWWLAYSRRSSQTPPQAHAHLSKSSTYGFLVNWWRSSTASTIRDRAAARVKWKNRSLPRVDTPWPHEARLMDYVAGCMSRVDASRWDLAKENLGWQLMNYRN